ncbi:hypothetical protein [Streptomyces niveus]|uniref:hypothetical protein n=1 Tax=Streptomyces niveus TaxID=193462 RepID=UPI0004CF4125|nr:hypothetical protein [Streptomyces niveus]
MPFFVVDDGAHSHPKMMRAKNAAVGLWMRVGSYVAQHLTDGHVPGPVATMYGSAPQISKLLAVGLWHEHGHTCPRCPAVRPGDFYMHDYRDSGNPSRAEVLDRRARAAAKKQRQRAGDKPAASSPGNRTLFDDEPAANRDGIDDESGSNHSPDSDEFAGQGDVSPGDSPGTSRARTPLHSTPLQKEGAEERENPAGSGARAAGPALSLISADWAPSSEDVLAAQLAREDSGRPRLTEQQLAAVTRKFVRRQLDDGRRAPAWGGRWQQWAESERIEDPAAGGVVVPFAGGAQQQTKGQQQREGLARLLQQTGEV